MDGNLPDNDDHFIAKAMCGTNVSGLSLRNIMIVSLWPLDDELLDCIIILLTPLKVMGSILKNPHGFGMR